MSNILQRIISINEWVEVVKLLTYPSSPIDLLVRSTRLKKSHFLSQDFTPTGRRVSCNTVADVGPTCPLQSCRVTLPQCVQEHVTS